MCGIVMGREKERGNLREKLASAASMPKDVVLGASLITVLGTKEVCIENYRGILEYTESLIRIQTKEKLIRVSGKHLQIEYYTNDEMKVTGNIYSLEFGDRGMQT